MHPDEVKIADFISWTKNKLLLMNLGPGGSIYLNCIPFAVDEILVYIYFIEFFLSLRWKWNYNKNNNEENGNEFVH